jgi:hypothetical protein
MTDRVYATVGDMRLFLVAPDEGGLWAPCGEWDGPRTPRPISEWPGIIAKWKVDMQKSSGFRVWVISHSVPKYWEQRDAVFRQGLPRGHARYRMDPHDVHLRNGNDRDPDSLFSVARGYIAMDTLEVAAAIGAAKAAHAEWVEAGKRFNAAKAAIPTMTEEEWLRLVPKPGTQT